MSRNSSESGQANRSRSSRRKRRHSKNRIKNTANALRALVIEGLGVAVVVFLFASTQMQPGQLEKFSISNFFNPVQRMSEIHSAQDNEQLDSIPQESVSPTETATPSSDPAAAWANWYSVQPQENSAYSTNDSNQQAYAGQANSQNLSGQYYPLNRNVAAGYQPRFQQLHAQNSQQNTPVDNRWRTFPLQNR